MKLKELKQNTLRLIGHYILFNSVNVLCKSLKITLVNSEVINDLKKQNQNYVLAFWHGTMLLPWYLHRNKNFVGLTSKSKDGDLLAKVLKNWNYEVVRGSSSKGGDVALGIMVDYARNKKSVAVTPDGPRGPQYKLKAGAVIAAKKSGVPLVLLGIGYSKKRFLNSWDNFQVPKFFTRAKAVYSNPVFVDKDLSYEETSEIIEKCEIRLNELQNQAQQF